VRIAVGGCGPKPIHLAEVDAALSAKFGDSDAALAAGRKLAGPATVDDVRAVPAIAGLSYRGWSRRQGQARAALEAR
jgi:CO/xanthine dehydrogenase FAD-binding subunit